MEANPIAQCPHDLELAARRLGRALSAQALSRALPEPTLVALAPAILARQRESYARLEAASSHLDATEWLAWFAAIALRPTPTFGIDAAGAVVTSEAAPAR